MKAKLIKVDTGWILMVDNKIYASHNDMLSIKNCQAIERGYDLDELAKTEYPIGEVWNDEEALIRELAFKKGFQKALELMSDKKFSRDDMIRASDWYVDTKGKKSIDELIESLQQTEWEVEIEMEPMNLDEIREQGKGFLNANTNKPKLDANGCLILRKK